MKTYLIHKTFEGTDAVAGRKRRPNTSRGDVIRFGFRQGIPGTTVESSHSI